MDNKAQYTLALVVSTWTTRPALYQAFRKFGIVASAKVWCSEENRFPNKEWMATTGRAFVRFQSSEDACAALAACQDNLVVINGRCVAAFWAATETAINGVELEPEPKAKKARSKHTKNPKKNKTKERGSEDGSEIVSKNATSENSICDTSTRNECHANEEWPKFIPIGPCPPTQAKAGEECDRFDSRSDESEAPEFQTESRYGSVCQLPNSPNFYEVFNERRFYSRSDTDDCYESMYDSRRSLDLQDFGTTELMPVNAQQDDSYYSTHTENSCSLNNRTMDEDPTATKPRTVYVPVVTVYVALPQTQPRFAETPSSLLRFPKDCAFTALEE